jgi:hypothetical protein
MKTFKLFLGTMMLAIMLSGIAQATPSSTFWTPMTPDIQSYGVPHLGVDNYFTVFKKANDGAGSFPTDAQLTIGILPFEKFQMEVGVDFMQPSDFPLSFNAKMGFPEGVLFTESPAIQAGIFNVGTERGVTNQDIAYLVIGKTLPIIGGRLSAGPYIGNSSVLVDSDGNNKNTGYMVAFDHGFIPVKDKEGNEYSQIVFAADYASGDNALGGGGFGLYYYFNKDISLLTGPTWFNNSDINGKWKWSIQLDINLPQVFGKK